MKNNINIKTENKETIKLFKSQMIIIWFINVLINL